MDGWDQALGVCARWQTNELETETHTENKKNPGKRKQIISFSYDSLSLFAAKYITYCDSIDRYIGFAGGAFFFLLFHEAQFVAQSSPFSHTHLKMRKGNFKCFSHVQRWRKTQMKRSTPFLCLFADAC